MNRHESPHTAHARSASDGSSRSAQSKTWSDGSSALGYDGTLTWLRWPSGFTCDSACGSRARVLERVGWRSWRGRDPWHRGRGPRLHHAPRTTAQEDVVEAAHEGLRLVLGAREVCEVIAAECRSVVVSARICSRQQRVSDQVRPMAVRFSAQVLFNVVVNQKREPNAFNVEKITDEYYAVMLEHVA